MKHDRLLSLLEQANSILITLATTSTFPNGQKLDDLNDAEFETIVVTTTQFSDSMQSMLDHLVSLRRKRTQARKKEQSHV
jgi:hypothetical protein